MIFSILKFMDPYCWCFLHWQDTWWSRSCIHVWRWSCEPWRTRKHTIVYPSSGTCYKVIALRPAYFVLKKKNSVTMGSDDCSKSSLSESGKCLVSPRLKGRGPFIAGRQQDKYKLFISISTKGFTWPVGPVSTRLVCQGRSEASTVPRPVLESSRLLLTVPRALHDSGKNGARVSSWRGFLARSLLGSDVPHREKASKGPVQSPHQVPLHRWSLRHGTVYTKRQYLNLPYNM
jgi:hypothetical protein